MMTRPIICCLLLTLCSFAQSAKSDTQEGKLVALENMWNQAQLHRDSGALEALIAERFINTEWDGSVSDRAKFMSDIRDPQFKPSVMTIQDVKVNLFRDTAIVVGVYHAKGSSSGKPYEHLGRFTDTWIYQNGKWECVASHTSLLKKQ